MAYLNARQIKQPTGQNVLTSAIERLEKLYAEGHRLVVSFSGGKDSTVVLECAIIAATKTNRLPVEVVMRDEEIAFPDLYEFCERTANRPEVDLTWLVANQPILNVFNRVNPYFWVFDPELSPDKWVRKPPSWHTPIKELNIEKMTTSEKFPAVEGKDTYAVIGLRTQESTARMYGLYSSKGYVTKANKSGVRNARPIYDWRHGDVFRMIHEFDLDYCKAYDTMRRLGVTPSRLRIGPPTMTSAGVDHLTLASKAWPKWFDLVADRCEGTRTAAMFGKRAISPQRQKGEGWEQTYKRECIDEAPADWIKQRAITAMESYTGTHSRHSTTDFPEVNPCKTCQGSIGSWKKLAEAMYNGDPFAFKTNLPYVEPEFFREGAGTWGGGKPAW